MNHICVICDSESSYARFLANYFHGKSGFPFEIQLFTSVDALEKYVEKKSISLALVAEKDYVPSLKNAPIAHLVILQEQGTLQDRELKQLYKYQSGEKLMKEILDWIAKEGELGRALVSSKKTKLIGIYSPVGRSYKTALAFTLGQLLAKKKKVLYLNMESYSGLTKRIGRDFDGELSDLFYYLQNAKEKLAYRLGSMVCSVEGMDILPPFGTLQDLSSIQKEEWEELFLEIESGSEYEYILLDLSDCVQGLFDLLRLCDRIYSVAPKDSFGEAKWEQYHQNLLRCQFEDVWEKTKQVELPERIEEVQTIHQYLFTPLAVHAKELVEEDSRL